MISHPVSELCKVSMPLPALKIPTFALAFV